MDLSAGIISMGGYPPAREIGGEMRDKLVSFLANQLSFPAEYIEHIDARNQLPGAIRRKSPKMSNVNL